MSKIDKIDEYAEEVEEEILFIGSRDDRENFEEAIIGIAEGANIGPVIAYDYEKLIEIYSRDMGYEDAVAHFEYNVAGTSPGEGAPVFIRKIT